MLDKLRIAALVLDGFFTDEQIWDGSTMLRAKRSPPVPKLVYAKPYYAGPEVFMCRQARELAELSDKKQRHCIATDMDIIRLENAAGYGKFHWKKEDQHFIVQVINEILHEDFMA